MQHPKYFEPELIIVLLVQLKISGKVLCKSETTCGNHLDVMWAST